MSRFDVHAIHRCGDCGAVRDDGRAYHGATCPYCEGELERYVKAGPEATIISTETARTARNELERAIARTGGPDGFEVGQRERLAATPLALARFKLDKSAEGAREPYREAFGDAVETLIAVGDLTGEEVNPNADPLTDRIFQARDELTRTFGDDPDEEPRAVDHDAA